MNSMTQPSAFEARDAEILGTAGTAAEPGPARAVEAVEYGSGWYHEAAIAAGEPAPAQRH